MLTVMDDILIMVVKSSGRRCSQAAGEELLCVSPSGCTARLQGHTCGPHMKASFVSVLKGLWDRDLPSKGLAHTADESFRTLNRL